MQPNMTISPEKDQAKIMTSFATSIKAQKKDDAVITFSNGAAVPLPEPLINMLAIVAKALARNNAVTLVVRSSWLTTQEAAELMGYSRQVVVDLIKKNKLKASKLGTHRRIKLSDLMEFMEQEDIQRTKAMSELITHTEEFDGYELEKPVNNS